MEFVLRNRSVGWIDNDADVGLLLLNDDAVLSMVVSAELLHGDEDEVSESLLVVDLFCLLSS